jgi:hypothetical protein
MPIKIAAALQPMSDEVARRMAEEFRFCFCRPPHTIKGSGEVDLLSNLHLELKLQVQILTL